MSEKTSISVDKDTADKFRYHRDYNCMTNDEFLNHLIDNENIEGSRKEVIEITEELLEVLQSKEGGSE